jgi:hypothetical protein
MRKSAKEKIVDIKSLYVSKKANFRHKKTCRSRFFQAGRLKHASRWYIFKRLAVLLEHAFQDFAHFHCVLQFFCFAGVARYATNNMTSVTQINSFVMRITHFQCGFYISVTQNGLHIHDLTG